jgi:hypothetical protein
MLSVACDSMKNEKLPGQVHGQTFVLIMGHAMADGAWRAVISNLPEKGHPPHSPTLPGHGPGTMRPCITHQDCVALVIAARNRESRKSPPQSSAAQDDWEEDRKKGRPERACG